jgi:hypothetical protein
MGVDPELEIWNGVSAGVEVAIGEVRFDAGMCDTGT